MWKWFHPLPVNHKLIGGRKAVSIPPLFYLSIAFGFGIWISLILSVPFFSLWLCALIGFGFLAASCVRVWFIPASAVFFFLLGLLYGLNDRSLTANHIFLSAPEGRISLEGMVTTVPEVVKRGRKETVSFVLESKNFYRSGTVYPTAGKVQVFLHNAGSEIHYGDDLRLKGSLETPKKVNNPYMFDYGLYLSHQGIFKIFRGIGPYSVARQKSNGGGAGLKSTALFVMINQLRSHLHTRIGELYPSPYSELAAALILGFRKNIPDPIKEAFIKTGTAHLIAISGLNISLVVALFYGVMSFLRMPRRINFPVMVLFIILYTALAGANIPVLRAGIMGCAVFVGFLLSQERNLKSAFFFSFFVLLAWQPSFLFSASFQLSFLAMASLLYILPKFERDSEIASAYLQGQVQKPNGPVPIMLPRNDGWFGEALSQTFHFLHRSFRQSLLASVSATLGMFPILLWYFNLFSVIGFICNLVAIPLCTLAIASTFLLLIIDFICPPLSAVISFLPLTLLRLELWFILKLAELPFGHFYSSSPSPAFFVFYYGCLIVWLAMGRFRHIQRISIFLMALGTAAFLCSAQVPASRNVLFDLGKPEAFFISFSNGAKCLINTGRNFPNNQAYWVIRSFLMARAIHKLDAILLTHMDSARAGGLRTILNYVRSNKIFVASGSKDVQKTNKYIGYQTKLEMLQAGSRIQFGANSDIYIELLAVSKGKVTSFSAVDHERKMLYILSADQNTFHALSHLTAFDFDMVYLPHHDAPMSDPEKRVLKLISAKYLVVNQREGLEKFLSEMKEITKGEILSLKELGAIEFMNSGSFTYRHYLTPEAAALLAT